MADEIELKLSLPLSQHPLLERHPLLQRAGPPIRKQVDNVYYDTSGHALWHRGITLRLRRQGDEWLQTVKCAGTSQGGLSVRPEWEIPHGGQFDFDAVTDRRVRRFLKKHQAALIPVFETRFKRCTWRLPANGEGALLLMLDAGWITAAGRRAPIAELELELAGADAGILFATARALAQDMQLIPENRSKAERGYRLFKHEGEAPVTAGAVPLTPDMSPAQAFHRLALAALDHFNANRDGLLTQDDPEYPHQMRVALRRLRATLQLFSPLLAPSWHTTQPLLQQLTTTLGAVRDLDVLHSDILTPVREGQRRNPDLAVLDARIAQLRAKARSHARAMIAAQEYGRFLLEILSLAHDESTRETADRSLAEFLHQRVQRLARGTATQARVAASLSAQDLHVLRIRMKRLRYGLESAAPLLHVPRRNIRRLAQLQFRLGQLNDIAIAGRILLPLTRDDPRLARAVMLVADGHRPRVNSLLRQIAADLPWLHRFPHLFP
ncbi:MAG: CHAD domain-containing protein [Proteobacteria bacterium]|nr:CHAD domain-containing protein [Pseudomonadota bacterium]HQR04008.1 CHAD domain-containing protein [Rhodocyclaceae bacterium]